MDAQVVLCVHNYKLSQCIKCNAISINQVIIQSVNKQTNTQKEDLLTTQTHSINSIKRQLFSVISHLSNEAFNQQKGEEGTPKVFFFINYGNAV